MFPLFVIVYMNWIDKRSQADECAMIGTCKISYLLFADYLILLQQSPARISFAGDCDSAEIEINTIKTDVLHVSRNLPSSVLVATKWSGTEGMKTQVSWSCIHE